jgi:hypothetical protein
LRSPSPTNLAAAPPHSHTLLSGLVQHFNHHHIFIISLSYFSVSLIFVDWRHFLISQPPPSWLDLDHRTLTFKKSSQYIYSPSSPLQKPQRKFKIATLLSVATVPEKTATVSENALL